MNRFASIIETVPQPCRIFGTALRPFSLGHHLLFLRLKLPYANRPAAQPHQTQLLQAVFVCAHDYEENLEGQLSGEWAPAFDKWLATVRKMRFSYAEAREVFQKHLEDGYRLPPVWRHIHKESINLSAPWEQLLKCRLISAGFAITDIMNGFLPERWYDYYTVAELRQLETCPDPAKWKNIFYTVDDALADEKAKA
jgi:hypothetical protein